MCERFRWNGLWGEIRLLEITRAARECSNLKFMVNSTFSVDQKITQILNQHSVEPVTSYRTNDSPEKLWKSICKLASKLSKSVKTIENSFRFLHDQL